MTKEQAIERLKKLDYLLDDVYSTGLVEDEERNKYQDAIETVLPMLEEKDKTISGKDKIIDLMAEYISNITDCPFEKERKYLDCERMGDVRTDKECWKQYFKNKAKEK